MGALGQGRFGHVDAFGGDLGSRSDAAGDVELEGAVAHLEGVGLDAGADIMFVLFTFVVLAGVGAIHALMLWAIAVRGNPWLVLDRAKRVNDN